MKRFKVGDRVYYCNFKVAGTIIAIEGSLYTIQWDNPSYNTRGFLAGDLTLVYSEQEAITLDLE